MICQVNDPGDQALGEGALSLPLRGVEEDGLHLERGGVDTGPYERGPVTCMITQ